MKLQRVRRRVGRGQHLNLELLIQGSRQELRFLQPLRDDVVELIRIFRIQPLGQPKQRLKRVVEP